MVKGVFDGSYYLEECATIDCVSTSANYENFCSDNSSHKSVSLCDSFFDFVSESQSYLMHPGVWDTIMRCSDKDKLKTGTTPAKPLDILVPEEDEEYVALFKSNKVCNNKVEKN